MPIHPSLTTATLTAASLLLAALPTDATPTAAQSSKDTPPGLVLIQGGRVKIGTKVKDAEQLILENEGMAPFLAGETPQHTVAVDDFLLMVSEVTNEQYAAFVAATDGRPPYSWGDKAIEAARQAWFEELNERRRAAKEAGEKFVSTGEKFEPERWWEENWKDADWEVPANIADSPVTYVAYEDVLGYARWAGLRLMTEYEYQCAGRGTTDQTYPWGDDWDAKKAAGLDMGRDKPWAVGSFPDGARNGVHDLVGNVWEWTSSPYVEYAGYKALTFKTGRGSNKREWSALAPFDANQRVVVGGSVHMNALALRLNTRMPTTRMQRTNALGFRCAATPKPGRDLAEYVAEGLILGTAKPEDLEYELESPTIFHRWTHEAPAGSQGDAVAAAGESGARTGPPAGYAVITGYDAMLFVPAKEINAVKVSALEDLTKEAGPVHLGVFYTTVAIAEPALAPGAYMVAFRAANELPKPTEGVEPPAWQSTPGLDPTVASYFFFDPEGTPVTTWPLATPVGYDSISIAGTTSFRPWVAPTKVDKDAPPPTPIDTMNFRVYIKGRQDRRGYSFDLPFKVQPGTVDKSWHN